MNRDAITPNTGANAIPDIDFAAMPHVLGRLNRLALRYPWRFALAVACALGAAVFNLVTPRLLGDAVNHAHRLLAGAESSKDAARAALYSVSALIVCSCALRGLLSGLQTYMGENLAQRVGYDLRLAFFEQLQRLSFSFHDSSHSGDLIARGMLDLEGVRAYLEMGVLRIVTLVLLVGLGAWRLLGIDPALGALALSFVPFVAIRAGFMGIRLRRTWLALQRMMSRLTLGMEENLQGLRVVRAFASQPRELQRFDVVSDQALDLSNQRITTRMAAMSVMNLAYYIAMGLVLLVGGREVAAGTLSVGTLTEFLTFMAILQQPVRSVGVIVNASARATSAGGRLFEVLDMEPMVRDAADAQPLRLEQGVLRFEKVSFTYPGMDTPVLSDISFELAPGHTLGIVGAPGSGKSTLAHLIPRFYDVSAGSVTIDGQDVRKLTLQSLREAIRLVQQDVFLFDISIHDNVAYADPLAEEERVVDATTAAQLHDYVSGLPQTYGTRVGERGVALSGGQRQRMTIARALLSKPAILVLDDATAAIDANTERLVRSALRNGAHGRATIVIAHRLSAIKDADEILVLSQGRVVERGTHAQLLTQDGDYAQLWKLQHGAARVIDEDLLQQLATSQQEAADVTNHWNRANT